MKRFLPFLFVTCLCACDNSGKIKADVDTTLNDVKSTKLIDSVEVKGGRILDTVKQQGGVLIDSARIKTDRLLQNAKKGLHGLRKKDSVR